MAREITHEARGPLSLDEDDVHPEKGDVAVCLCGLSADYPFCDGSHRATADEKSDVVYKYEGDLADGPRRVVEEIVLADEESATTDD